jgi:dienelactone hydrolase
MAELLLFHHALGRTKGVLAFADIIRQAGHTVHVPDLYEGHHFDDLEAGVSFAEGIGFDRLLERGVREADSLPPDIVYAGFSLGVLPAQKLAQTRPGAAGALLFEACVPAAAFGAWPLGVKVQIHGMTQDKWFADAGDLAAARELVAGADAAELFLYEGDQHLFADSSLPAYDEPAAALLIQRVLTFLRTITR